MITKTFSLLFFTCLLWQLQAGAQTAATALFGTDDVLTLKLSGNIRELFNDRGDDPQYHPLQLSYKDHNNSEVVMDIKAKTRGHFRKAKENCAYPPILLNFQNSKQEASLFDKQKKLKLVVPCRGETYVIREYLVYKLYNLLTPKSFRARLVKVTFGDTEKGKETSFYGMLLEDDNDVASRNSVKVVNPKMLQGEYTETETFFKMAVFQYMIGNTDWSVPYLHNIKAIAFDSASIPSVVPYDFDHAGIVDAPYALPPEQLGLSSTHERRYRGFCIDDITAYNDVIATFNRLKDQFYNVYTSSDLIDSKYKTATIKYLDQFYETINNPKKLKAAFGYPCNHNQPNVVIKGLDNE